MKVKGLIFDFDGLILDTETPQFRSWKLIYRKNGLDFPSSAYKATIGSNNIDFALAQYIIENSKINITRHQQS